MFLHARFVAGTVRVPGLSGSKPQPVCLSDHYGVETCVRIIHPPSGGGALADDALAQHHLLNRDSPHEKSRQRLMAIDRSLADAVPQRSGIGREMSIKARAKSSKSWSLSEARLCVRFAAAVYCKCFPALCAFIYKSYRDTKTLLPSVYTNRRTQWHTEMRAT